MDASLLNGLLGALALSPDNPLLRRQVVDALARLERWDAVEEHAPPLLEHEDQRAFGRRALAYAAMARHETSLARELYLDAIRENRDLIDEHFELRLEPDGGFRVPSLGPPQEEEDEEVRAVLDQPPGPKVTFADIGGMEDVKEQIRLKIIHPFTQPHLYAAYGKKAGGGLLLYGAPGCGKTHLARATAGEMGARFFLLTLEDVLNMWVGQTEKQLHAVFEEARANAPAVLFIDEVDALGAKRSDIQHASVRWMITQMLTEMDGIAARNEGLLVMGATNAPWSVDPALRRPGRFDRILFVPPPDSPAREEILRIHARGRRIEPNLQWRVLADRTNLFSGADLEALMEQATDRALSEALKTGRMRDVTLDDFLAVLKTLKPTTMEWLRRARGYVTYSNADGFYDELGQFLDRQKIR